MKNERSAVVGRRVWDTRLLARIGLLAALSCVVLLVVPRVSLVAAAPYLQYDMADVPILLAAFLLGAGPGGWVLLVVSLVQGLLLGENGLVGALMHFCATGSLLLAATQVAKRIPGTKGLVAGLAVGVLVWTAVMIPLNLIITVHVFGQPEEVVRAAMLPGIIPFNFLKATLNSLIFFFIYKVNEKVFRDLLK